VKAVVAPAASLKLNRCHCNSLRSAVSHNGLSPKSGRETIMHTALTPWYTGAKFFFAELSPFRAKISPRAARAPDFACSISTHSPTGSLTSDHRVSRAERSTEYSEYGTGYRRAIVRTGRPTSDKWASYHRSSRRYHNPLRPLAATLLSSRWPSKGVSLPLHI
jgi:hypothetical protein